MILNYQIAGAAFAGALLVASGAAAAPGIATNDVNMRSGPGTRYDVITTIPAGAPMEVFDCQSWCQVAYGGTQGFVSARYVAGDDGYVSAPRGYYRSAPRVYYEPAPRVYYRDRYRGNGYPYWRRDRWHDDWRWRNRGPSFGIQFGF